MEEDNTTIQAEDTTGLKAKNAELMSKLKTANASISTLTSRLDAMEDAQNDALDTTKSDAEKHANKLQKQIDQLTLKLTASETRASALLIDGVIADAMVKNGVMPQYTRSLTAMLKAEAKMENGEAMADGVPLSEHISTFFASADALHYVAAPANSGGGAQGSSAVASRWTVPPTAAEMNDWADWAVSNPDQANSLTAKWHRPDLEV